MSEDNTPEERLRAWMKILGAIVPRAALDDLDTLVAAARPAPKVHVPTVLCAVARALREYDLDDPVTGAEAHDILFRLIAACDSAAGNAGNTWTDLAAVYDAAAPGTFAGVSDAVRS